MEPTRHIEILRREGALLAATPPDALDLAVPSVDDMTVERVLRHTGKVHRWVVAALAAGPNDDLPRLPSLPRGPACIDAYGEALDAVVTALAERDPDEAAWTFAGPGTTRFWARRQAHEVTIHRHDVSDAIATTGGPPPEPMEPDGALDGIDEWLEVFLTPYWSARGETPPEEVRARFEITAGAPPNDRTWVVAITEEGVEISEPGEGAGVPDTVISGSADRVFLALWRRRSVETLEIAGDPDPIRSLLDRVRI